MDFTAVIAIAPKIMKQLVVKGWSPFDLPLDLIYCRWEK